MNLTQKQLTSLCGKWTLAQLIEEAEREVDKREEVYARLVQLRKMTQHAADEQTGKMRRIVAILSALASENPRAAGLLL